MKRRTAVLAIVIAATLQGNAGAWGKTGHEEINAAAMRALPAGVPAFLTTSETVTTVQALGPEMDRLKGAGYSWDHDSDPAHFLDLGDDGTIAGTVSIHRLPEAMEGYAAQLAAAGTDPFRAGYLPYAIADGWEQLRKDFAYWRAFNYLQTHGPQAVYRESFGKARELREALTIHDLGIWAHYVGDGSQPLHVSIHYNGWGKYDNPKGYTQEPIHALFEGAFVRDHVTAAAVAREVPAANSAAPDHLLDQAEILAAVGNYLAQTQSHVDELYQIAGSGGFRNASAPAIAFATQRVADGARELRDLILLAWENSRYASVGYPEIPVRSILDGSVVPGPSAFGGD
ncbi:MAG TPA: hypothetical protein VGI19_03785 [Candidatus Cybelea sp.]